MSVSPDLGLPTRNRLLVVLPSETYARLAPQLERVSLNLKDVLHETGGVIPYVYFPEGGVVSLVTEMADGARVEIATIGNEGMVGLPVFLGAETVPSIAITQVAGEALRMKAELFRELVDQSGALHNLLHRYTQALFNLIAQAGACNRVHSIEQRCCRWLLMTHDRVHSDRFFLTQEFLGQMLGVRRSSVNAVARALQEQGLIRYSRGRITIRDRAGLEAASCECYRVIQREFERLLG